MLQAMFGLQLIDVRTKYLMMVLYLYEAIDYLAMVWRDDGHVLRKVFVFEAKGQIKKRMPKGHGRSRLRRKTLRLD